MLGTETVDGSGGSELSRVIVQVLLARTASFETKGRPNRPFGVLGFPKLEVLCHPNKKAPFRRLLHFKDGSAVKRETNPELVPQG